MCSLKRLKQFLNKKSIWRRFHAWCPCGVIVMRNVKCPIFVFSRSEDDHRRPAQGDAYAGRGHLVDGVLYDGVRAVCPPSVRGHSTSEMCGEPTDRALSSWVPGAYQRWKWVSLRLMKSMWPPVITHWSYVFLVLTHRYGGIDLGQQRLR